MLLLLIAFLVLEFAIFVLDVRHMRASTWAGWGPSARVAAFLVVVVVVFLAIQVVGNVMVPGAAEILSFLRLVTNEESGVGSVETNLRGGAWILLAVGLFYVAGFWDYVVHRWFSHSRWFWATHEYHHLPTELSVVMPGILGRPFAFIPGFLATLATGLTLYAFACLRGSHLWDDLPLVPVALAIVLVQTASHSCALRRNWKVHRWLRLCLLTTPQEHVLHHAVDSPCNYGTFTSLWDHVFGTYRDPVGMDLESLPLGLSYDQDFLGTLTMGYWKLSPAMRKRFQVSRFCRLAGQVGDRSENKDD